MSRLALVTARAFSPSSILLSNARISRTPSRGRLRDPGSGPAVAEPALCREVGLTPEMLRGTRRAGLSD
jgi:hypothetical protein